MAAQLKMLMVVMVVVALTSSCDGLFGWGRRGRWSWRWSGVGNKQAEQVLGRCISGNTCSGCANAVVVARNCWFGSCTDVKACAANCGPIHCIDNEDGTTKQCVCPSAASTTCAYEDGCASCNQLLVTNVSGFRVCCSNCANAAVSFNGTTCSCNTQP